ncbi:MAG: M20/M25/M40 family metallo-hydrolase [Chloroflexi bacterium]|nr:M20/M25/M40 family metallo-hydrolase [Chloroflexota bacterium]
MSDTNIVSASVDVEAGKKWLMEMIDISSPTGSEAAMGQYMLERFRALGLETRTQEVEDNRFNAIGILKGSGGGSSLMFDAHMDTSLTGMDEHDISVLGEMHPGFRAKAFMEDNFIRGLGAWNMKHALASYLMAVDALVKSRVRLKGDVVIAAVVGEIEKTPVETVTRPYQGALYRGAGLGTRYLATHGVRTDYAIVGELNDLHITAAHPGYCWFKISVLGHFTRTTAIERGVNAVKKAARVIDALDLWGRAYTRRETEAYAKETEQHPYYVVKPNVNMGAIEGGWPYKPTWSTAICNLYLDVRTIPGKDPIAVQQEVEQVLEGVSQRDPQVKTRVEMYMSNPGGRLDDPQSYLVKAAEKAIAQVKGKEPGRVPEEFGSYWCDMNILNRLGIPAITVGPGNEREARFDGKGEYVAVQELLDAAQVYALCAQDICNTARPQM